MLRLLMIADDFTGALDTGVQLAAHGIPTQVVVGQADLSACSSTVLVVDTETRHLSAAKAAKAARAARSSRSSRSSGRGGYGAGFDTGGKRKNKVKPEYHGVPKSEILALGYGPISEAKFDYLIDSKAVEIKEDKNGNLHVKKRNVSIPPNPGKPNFSLGTKLF